MALRFRKTFTLFPGVRLNVGKSGISTSIGTHGATVNVSGRGVRATVGIPGSGLSYTTPNVPYGSSGSQSMPVGNARYEEEHRLQNETPPVYIPREGMREIGSASVKVLTSPNLQPLKDMFETATVQQRQIERDLSDAEIELTQKQSELLRKSGSIFRWFYRKRIAELEESVPVVNAEVERLQAWKKDTHISVEFESNDKAQKAYAALVRAFEGLRGCRKVWDITSDRDTNRLVERTEATRVIDRHPAKLEFSQSELIHFDGRAMRFENVNGEDILLYPGIAVMPRPDGAFALIDLRDLEVSAELTGFVEDDAVPPDAKVVAQTWAKTNKDGSPDRRFKDNYQIPVCEYGRLVLRSGKGIAEEYQVSKGDAAIAFAASLKNYQNALD